MYNVIYLFTLQNSTKRRKLSREDSERPAEGTNRVKPHKLNKKKHKKASNKSHKHDGKHRESLSSISISLKSQRKLSEEIIRNQKELDKKLTEITANWCELKSAQESYTARQGQSESINLEPQPGYWRLTDNQVSFVVY